MPAPFKSAVLPSSAWKAALKESSLDFKDLQNTKQTPSFHSPCYSNATVPSADILALRDAEKLGDLNACDLAWLGQAFLFKHRFAVRFVTDAKNVWYLPIKHWPESAVALIEVRLSTIRKVPFFTMMTGPPTPPILRLIHDLRPSFLQVVPIVWRSWEWQVEKHVRL